MGASPLLQVREVSMRIGGIQALNGVTLAVQEGEIVGLIGPNGAGKTTLFNIINGIHAPTAGRVEFVGRDVTGVSPYRICRLGIARTFQVGRAFPNMTVRDNLMVGLRYGRDGHSLSVSGREEKVQRLLEFLSLAQKRDQLVGHLNIMDRKIVELGRALANAPRLILMDEILAGLSATDLPRVAGTIRRIRDEMGVTIFWVEHIMGTLMNTCERIIVLHYGEKLAEGSPAEVVENLRVREAYLGRRALSGRSRPA